MKEILLYIVLIMILYDFSLHLLELIFGLEKVRKLKPYWPEWIFTIKGEFHRRLYAIFWTIYWAIAFILLLMYLF